MDQTSRTVIARARNAFEARDYVRALEDFREALETHPGYADLHHMAALCLSFLGQPEAALEEFDRALGLNDRYVEAHLNRAIVLNELGRFEEAREAFERARRFETETGGPYTAAAAHRLALAYADLGDLYDELGAVAEAAAEHRRAVGLRPGYPDLRNRLARVLLRAGELDEAERHLNAALQKDPSFVRARANRGLVHYRRGDRERALREWTECRREAPADPIVRAYLSMAERPEGSGPPAPAEEPEGPPDWPPT